MGWELLKLWGSIATWLPFHIFTPAGGQPEISHSLGPAPKWNPKAMGPKTSPQPLPHWFRITEKLWNLRPLLPPSSKAVGFPRCLSLPQTAHPRLHADSPLSSDLPQFHPEGCSSSHLLPPLRLYLYLEPTSLWWSTPLPPMLSVF